MKYNITFNGSKLTSSCGYKWRAVDKGGEFDKVAAQIINDSIYLADHHDAIAVILERLGDSVEVGDIP